MPSDEAKRARLLFGTDEAVEPLRRLRAGRLSADLHAGALRDIRWEDREVLRGLAFVVRDTRWGTYVPTLTALAVREDPNGFTVSYDATIEGPEGRFACTVRFEATAGGRLRAEATGRSPQGFATNRTGFVVLHPLEGVAGRPLEVTHPDGTVTRTAYPDQVQPDQPATAIAGLRHEPAPGLAVALRFEGNVFEMEDHRNWTDASFKTYVRPLSRGFPYRIEPGEVLSQAVELTVTGSSPATAPARHQDDVVTVRWGGEAGAVMPALGLHVDEAVLADPAGAADVVTSFRPGYLQVRADLREAAAIPMLDRALDIARSGACRLQVDAVIAGRDPAMELAPLAGWVARARPELDVLFVVPARDLRSRPAGHLPAGEAAPATILAAARGLFPGVSLAGGMPVGFAEFNRNRPPAGIDWATHATQAIVHAADDRSVMQTLEALPSVIASTRAMVGSCPYRLGPATIGMLASASASPPIITAGDRRIAMASRDPRQAGLFAAAFLVGLVAQAGGVQAVTPAAPVGDAGLVGPAGEVRPVAPVFAALATRAGAPRLHATPDYPHRLAAVALAGEAGPELWLANLTGEPVEVHLHGPAPHSVWVLDAGHLPVPAGAAVPYRPPPGSPSLRLDSHAVCRIHSAGA